jgi:two-component system chemotaxis response regulator CheY
LSIVSSITGIIVADDDPVIRGILRTKLAAIGQDVFLAVDGEEAIAFAQRMRAALVILDLKMPRLNGLLACQRIRQLPGYEQTPIVILTSSDGEQVEAAATRVGATAFLTKPFRSGPLMEVLSRFLRIDAVTLRAIRLSAVRVTRMAGPGPAGVPAPARDEISAGLREESGLDRGKTILALLRG